MHSVTFPLQSILQDQPLNIHLHYSHSFGGWSMYTSLSVIIPSYHSHGLTLSYHTIQELFMGVAILTYWTLSITPLM